MPDVCDVQTSEGNFKVRLFDDKAPKTVANFTGLAEGTKEWTDPKTRQKVTRPFYDGLIFHRVIDGFMLQGGCPMGNGMGGPGYQFADEFGPGLRHDRPGMLSMANAGPEHQRQPVLRHARAHAVARQQACDLRRSRRGHGRRAEDRQDANRTRTIARVKDIVINSVTDRADREGQKLGQADQPIDGTLRQTAIRLANPWSLH